VASPPLSILWQLQYLSCGVVTITWMCVAFVGGWQWWPSTDQRQAWVDWVHWQQHIRQAATKAAWNPAPAQPHNLWDWLRATQWWPESTEQCPEQRGQRAAGVRWVLWNIFRQSTAQVSVIQWVRGADHLQDQPDSEQHEVDSEEQATACSQAGTEAGSTTAASTPLQQRVRGEQRRTWQQFRQSPQGGVDA